MLDYFLGYGIYPVVVVSHLEAVFRSFLLTVRYPVGLSTGLAGRPEWIWKFSLLVIGAYETHVQTLTICVFSKSGPEQIQTH